MPEAAATLLDLLENDAVEPLSSPGRAMPAGEVAERLETRVDRLRRRADDLPEDLEMIEDAVAHLRAHENDMVAPWTFEDSDGIRWFVLSRGDEIVACYNSAPFVDADV